MTAAARSTRKAIARRGRIAVALALLASCGGTTGLEKIVADADPPAPEVDGTAGRDATGDDALPLDGPVPFDATGPPDGPAFFDAAALLDATAPLDTAAGDRTLPERPPRRETGAPPTYDSGKRAADAGRSPDGAGLTTLSILAAQSPGCVAFEPADAADEDGNTAPRSVAVGCAVASHCLDPVQQGGVCELSGGLVPDGRTDGAAPEDPVGSPGYAANCLQTLHDIFSSHCADSPQGITPCLCGYDVTVTAGCLQGVTPPTGPLVDDYLRSFAPQAQNVAVEIEAHFTNQVYGAGQANALVQCLAQYNCSCCFDADGGCTN